GRAKARPGEGPRIAAASGRSSSPPACARPARKASLTTGTVRPPRAPARVAGKRSSPKKPTEGTPLDEPVNVTRTLASVSASPILNQDQGRYQPLTAYVSHAIACPATNTGRKTESAPRRIPESSDAAARVSGEITSPAGKPALIRRAGPQPAGRPPTGAEPPA